MPSPLVELHQATNDESSDGRKGSRDGKEGRGSREVKEGKGSRKVNEKGKGVGKERK